MLMDSTVSPLTPAYMHLALSNHALADAKDTIRSFSIWSGMVSIAHVVHSSGDDYYSV